MANSTLKSVTEGKDWNRVVDEAKDAAASVGDMASQAASTVGSMASQAACDVTKRANDLTAQAGVGMQGLGEQIRKNAPQSGMLGDASQAVARTVTEGGEYLEEAQLTGITKDLAQLVRNNPIPAVFIALGLGWFVASKLRN